MPTMQEFWLKMKSLLVSARHAINVRLNALDLTSAAGDIIFNLMQQKDGLSQEELRERLNVGKAAVSRTVDSLVLKGYVQKNRHPLDARAYRVVLTQKGLDISQQVSDAYCGVFDVIKRDIPGEDFLRVALLLDRIQSNLNEERAKE